LDTLLCVRLRLCELFLFVESGSAAATSARNDRNMRGEEIPIGVEDMVLGSVANGVRVVMCGLRELLLLKVRVSELFLLPIRLLMQ
jgi:hypothetical protein